MESRIAFLSQHAVTKLYAMKKKKKFKNIFQQKGFHMIHHDVCTRHVNAHIHQGLNPRPQEIQ
jgi:hypothetical protein